MNGEINIFTAIIIIIVGLYDIAIAINRRHQAANRKGIIAYAVLGSIFLIAGLILLITKLIN